jgi:hypothetical protein
MSSMRERKPASDPLRLLLEPVLLERIEGGILFGLSLLLYWKHSDPWWLYLLLILAPDLFMVGYVRGPRAGAALYNLGHTWLLPGIIAAGGILGGSRIAISLALIWLGHIGMDRLLGYGLKYPTGFKDTHLGRF